MVAHQGSRPADRHTQLVGDVALTPAPIAHAVAQVVAEILEAELERLRLRAGAALATLPCERLAAEREALLLRAARDAEPIHLRRHGYRRAAQRVCQLGHGRP